VETAIRSSVHISNFSEETEDLNEHTSKRSEEGEDE
jgi:hypothetical protein